MSRDTLNMDARLIEYLREVSVRDDDVLRRLREETDAHERGAMQISPEQGQVMALLVRLLRAKKCLEIGTFTGYSALSVARELPDEGVLVCLDISDEYTSIARRYWAEAGVADRIDLRVAPALESLAELDVEWQRNTFDFAFIDADKANYEAYYEHCLRLVRPGGLIAVDNALWGGSVADPDDDREDTVAIRALNAKIHGDDRVTPALLPIGDGLMLAVKR